jgi:hypothetical protein
MNVEIGAEAALNPEKEYLNGIAVAVWNRRILENLSQHSTRGVDSGHLRKIFISRKCPPLNV